MSATSTSQRETAVTFNSNTKAMLYSMDDGCAKNASIGSATMATLLGSLNDDLDLLDDYSERSEDLTWEDTFPSSSSSCNTSNDNVKDTRTAAALSDFSCASMDLNDLLPLDQQEEVLRSQRRRQQEDQDQDQQQQQDQQDDEEDGYESFHQSYNLGKALGEGAFGTVHRCYDVSDSGTSTRTRASYAVKAVPMDKYNHEEIEILGDLLDCPTITQLRDVFFENDQSFIVMEEMQGGELLERISEKEYYTEVEAKILFKTLLETVQFCHSRGVAHCDIKPENILLRYKDEDTSIQLADFGLAKRFVDENGRRVPLLDMSGSAEYAAPEVFNRPDDDDVGYDERCDIWSCGVLLYILLAGYAPFDSDNPWETIKLVGRGKFKFHNRYWKDVSMEAKVLIVKMLQVNPDERCTLEEALESPWFEDISSQDQCY